MELLKFGDESDDYSQFVTLLRGMTPTAVDQELRALEASHAACITLLVCLIMTCSCPIKS